MKLLRLEIVHNLSKSTQVVHTASNCRFIEKKLQTIVGSIFLYSCLLRADQIAKQAISPIICKQFSSARLHNVYPPQQHKYPLLLKLESIFKNPSLRLSLGSKGVLYNRTDWYNWPCHYHIPQWSTECCRYANACEGSAWVLPGLPPTYPVCVHSYRSSFGWSSLRHPDLIYQPSRLVSRYQSLILDGKKLHIISVLCSRDDWAPRPAFSLQEQEILWGSGRWGGMVSRLAWQQLTSVHKSSL